METVNLTAVPASPGVTKRDTARDISMPAPAVAAGVVEREGAQGVPSSDEVHSAVADMKAFAQRIERNLDFSVDDSSGRVVVKVLDGDSGEVIRQIPSEELLRLSEHLEDMRSLLFQAKA